MFGPCASLGVSNTCGMNVYDVTTIHRFQRHEIRSVMSIGVSQIQNQYVATSFAISRGSSRLCVTNVEKQLTQMA